MLVLTLLVAFTLAVAQGRSYTYTIRSPTFVRPDTTFRLSVQLLRSRTKCYVTSTITDGVISLNSKRTFIQSGSPGYFIIKVPGNLPKSSYRLTVRGRCTFRFFAWPFSYSIRSTKPLRYFPAIRRCFWRRRKKDRSSSSSSSNSSGRKRRSAYRYCPGGSSSEESSTTETTEATTTPITTTTSTPTEETTTTPTTIPPP